MLAVSLLLIVLVSSASARPERTAPHDHDAATYSSHTRHRRSITSMTQSKIRNEEELHADFWNKKAQETLKQKILQKHNTNKAKNVILFLGDGMSIPTIKAARLYMAQMNNQSGEEEGQLAFEKFPYTALSKTYCVDKQVPDSACTSTAYLCGVKGNDATIGVTASVSLGNCSASLKEENRVYSIGKWSQLKNKRTGFVTTTRVTHASPAGLYAHTAHRDWESDAYNVPPECKDIAHQLINSEVGQAFNVIMGGGRREMIPSGEKDEEGQQGTRKDGNNLIKQWIRSKSDKNAQYVWNRTSLLNLSPKTDYLLGLFEGSHCNYHLDATEEDPSIEEMTEAAIKILSKSKEGFFLFVEGGRIDHAHHDTHAKKALDETVEFSKAIQKAYDITNPDETLIVVTSDHAHVMSVAGYPDRGNDILGVAGIADDKLPYSTISYANGPGYKKSINDVRNDVSKEDMHDKNFRFPSLAPLDQETHGGDEVAVFANGPWSHLLIGVIEQNVIPHVLAYASCVGEGATVCDNVLPDEPDKPYPPKH